MLASLYPGKPQEAITREQAVTAYTLTAAYAEFAEKDTGSLEPGKRADLAVRRESCQRQKRCSLWYAAKLFTMRRRHSGMVKS